MGAVLERNRQLDQLFEGEESFRLASLTPVVIVCIPVQSRPDLELFWGRRFWEVTSATGPKTPLLTGIVPFFQKQKGVFSKKTFGHAPKPVP